MTKIKQNFRFNDDLVLFVADTILRDSSNYQGALRLSQKLREKVDREITQRALKNSVVKENE